VTRETVNHSVNFVKIYR